MKRIPNNTWIAIYAQEGKPVRMMTLTVDPNVMARAYRLCKAMHDAERGSDPFAFTEARAKLRLCMVEAERVKQAEDNRKSRSGRASK